MPGGDKTGPCGLGAKTGRGRGECNSIRLNIIFSLVKFAMANWKIVLSLLVTAILALKGRKLSDNLLHGRATRILLPDKSADKR